MCFSSSPAVPAVPTAADYAYYDADGNATTGDKPGATRRLKVTPGMTSIMGDAWAGGSDSAGNSVGVSTDASGNSNAGSSASGW